MNRAPLIGKKPVVRVNCSLPPEVKKALQKIGGGNLSAGIRAILAHYEATKP